MKSKSKEIRVDNLALLLAPPCVFLGSKGIVLYVILLISYFLNKKERFFAKLLFVYLCCAGVTLYCGSRYLIDSLEFPYPNEPYVMYSIMLCIGVILMIICPLMLLLISNKELIVKNPENGNNSISDKLKNVRIDTLSLLLASFGSCFFGRFGIIWCITLLIVYFFNIKKHYITQYLLLFFCGVGVALRIWSEYLFDSMGNVGIDQIGEALVYALISSAGVVIMAVCPFVLMIIDNKDILFKKIKQKEFNVASETQEDIETLI